MTIYRLGLSLLLLSLVSCASVPDAPSFAEFSKQYEAMKVPEPERVVFDFGAACNDEGMCLVKRETLEAATIVITKMNDANQIAIKAGNTRLDSIAHCEYANAKQAESINYLEQSRDKTELTGQVKQFITMLGCGALLWAK